MKDENKISEHTVKKFELIEKYVNSWIQKLMNNPYCKEVAFIDCMCNSGIYEFDGNRIEGTPVRVARIIANAMPKYPNKKAALYFNDLDAQKIAELKNHLPPNTDNFQIHLSADDGNNLLKNLHSNLLRRHNLNYLLFYDPYKAAIDWNALAPYFFGWGEVILNHMVYDTNRAVTSAKLPQTIDRYERTYLTSIEELTYMHGDKNSYNERIKEIIKRLAELSKREYYLASFPFFIKTNAQIYNIIFFTKNIVGFKLFKKCAWQTFGGKSSNQNTHGKENQLSLSFEMPPEEKDCYHISDIADYIVNSFKGRTAVPLKEIWALLDEHPIFPAKGYIPQIKATLKQTGRCNLHTKDNTADFIAR